MTDTTLNLDTPEGAPPDETLAAVVPPEPIVVAPEESDDAVDATDVEERGSNPVSGEHRDEPFRVCSATLQGYE